MFAVLDLTVYEVGNAIWKNYKRGTIVKIDAVVKVFEELLSLLRRLSIESEVGEVMEMAIENSLTFYDAAYLYIAKRYGLKLVTEDQRLLKFSETLNVKTLLRELSRETM